VVYRACQKRPKAFSNRLQKCLSFCAAWPHKISRFARLNPCIARLSGHLILFEAGCCPLKLPRIIHPSSFKYRFSVQKEPRTCRRQHVRGSLLWSLGYLFGGISMRFGKVGSVLHSGYLSGAVDGVTDGTLLRLCKISIVPFPVSVKSFRFSKMHEFTQNKWIPFQEVLILRNQAQTVFQKRGHFSSFAPSQVTPAFGR
jgi:hypothetical protein